MDSGNKTSAAYGRTARYDSEPRKSAGDGAKGWFTGRGCVENMVGTAEKALASDLQQATYERVESGIEWD
ncbi:hypothetical protein CGMCC3_g8135 [Colletotrichum fructicola]|nr:uncharacterized protein CGMCC3_g8135 [Colletotrichum fructicola]KAE9575992.1 hypothetical protein CGMCC3_g8135 [Colletotrichum fructicola]